MADDYPLADKPVRLPAMDNRKPHVGYIRITLWIMGLYMQYVNGNMYNTLISYTTSFASENLKFMFKRLIANINVSKKLQSNNVTLCLVMKPSHLPSKT